LKKKKSEIEKVENKILNKDTFLNKNPIQEIKKRGRKNRKNKKRFNNLR